MKNLIPEKLKLSFVLVIVAIGVCLYMAMSYLEYANKESYFAVVTVPRTHIGELSSIYAHSPFSFTRINFVDEKVFYEINIELRASASSSKEVIKDDLRNFLRRYYDDRKKSFSLENLKSEKMREFDVKIQKWKSVLGRIQSQKPDEFTVSTANLIQEKIVQLEYDKTEQLVDLDMNTDIYSQGTVVVKSLEHIPKESFFTKQFLLKETLVIFLCFIFSAFITRIPRFFFIIRQELGL